MGTKTFLFLSISLAILFSWRATAEEVSGRTADGCTYKIINGQYLTSCPGRAGKAPTRTAPPVVRDQVHTVSSASVTDYGSVPMRYNATATAPSLPPLQHYAGANPNSPVSAIEKDDPPSAASEDEYDDAGRARLKARLVDQTYVGLNLGASNVTQTSSSSAMGFGLVVGTNIDDTFGVELGYSYGSQNLNLGLATRGSSTDPTAPSASPSGLTPSSDSSLATNLFTGEVKAHLTDPVKRLRPYLGAGLGWRSATLTETPDSLNNLAGGSLHQNTLGGLASVGTTFRITKAVSLALALNYYFPLLRPDATLNQPLASATGGASQTALTQDDDLLTGSSQYQVLGGLHYSF